MKFKKLLDIGAGILGTANPLVGAGIKLVNKFLPEDKKLPETATNGEVLDAVNSLPPEQRISLMEKELEVEIQEIKSHSENLKTLAEVDMNGSSTRPFIALMMSWVIVLTVLPLAWAFSYAIIMDQTSLMEKIADNYMLVLVLIATPIWVVKAYFGHRTEEKKARYALSANQLVAQNQSVLGTIAGALTNGKQ